MRDGIETNQDEHKDITYDLVSSYVHYQPFKMDMEASTLMILLQPKTTTFSHEQEIQNVVIQMRMTVTIIYI